MDSSLLGELLINARTQKDDVLLITSSGFEKIIHSWNSFEFKEDSLVLTDTIISLDSISVAKIIPTNNIGTCSKKPMRLI